VPQQFKLHHRLSLPAVGDQGYAAAGQDSCDRSWAQGKHDLAGAQTFQDTSSPPLTVASGGQSWDWPLSRHERKERVKMIDDHVSQIDQTVLMRENGKLLAELDELRRIHAKNQWGEPAGEAWERI